MAATFSISGSLLASSGGTIAVNWSGLDFSEEKGNYGTVTYTGPYTIYLRASYGSSETPFYNSSGAPIVITTSSASGTQSITVTAADISYNTNQLSSDNFSVNVDPEYQSESFYTSNWGGVTYTGSYYISGTSTGSVSVSSLIFTAPGTPTVNYSGSQFTVSWTSSSASGGSGSVSYKIIYGDSENGYGVYSTSSVTSPQTIARWTAPTWNDITYRFYIQATYSGKTLNSEATDYTQAAPYITWSNKTLTISQVNNQVKVSWNAATLNNNYSSQSVKYTLVCYPRGSGSEAAWSTTTTATSVTFTPDYYDTELFFQVHAGADNVRGGVYSTGVYETIYSPRFTTAPGKPTITQSGSNYVITWTKATAQYGSSSDAINYTVLVGDYDEWSAGTSTSLTHAIPDSLRGVSVNFSIYATYSTATAWGESTPFTASDQTPSITTQPSITSISPTSGTSTTIKWSAAVVSNQGDATIYYQYFVGPTSTYSDSYHIGTTTGLTATITSANIEAKCGSTFEGTCYLYVRAYWDDGTTSGSWTTPTGSAFNYTPHRTVKYYTGGNWVECIVHYYDGSNWIECYPYRYNGSGWDELTH